MVVQGVLSSVFHVIDVYEQLPILEIVRPFVGAAGLVIVLSRAVGGYNHEIISTDPSGHNTDSLVNLFFALNCV
jgi:hypothetical protein